MLESVTPYQLSPAISITSDLVSWYICSNCGLIDVTPRWNSFYILWTLTKSSLS